MQFVLSDIKLILLYFIYFQVSHAVVGFDIEWPSMYVYLCTFVAVRKTFPRCSHESNNFPLLGLSNMLPLSERSCSASNSISGIGSFEREGAFQRGLHLSLQ